jgi:hypothetical protein
LARKADLQKPAGQFAHQLTELLNRTITDGVRVKSVLEDDGRVGWVGYEITRQAPFPGRPIPVARAGGRSHCWLYVQYTLHRDDEGYLTVEQSTFALHVGQDLDSDSLFHYDYNRNPDTDYPEAHIQVPGSSPALTGLGQQFGRQWELGQLHFPVGGRRFRPCLEDVVEFLVVEEFVDPRDGWRDVLAEHRQRFHQRQLAAAVRRDPGTAKQALLEAEAEERARTKGANRPRLRRR